MGDNLCRQLRQIARKQKSKTPYIQLLESVAENLHPLPQTIPFRFDERSSMERMHPISALHNGPDQDLFESVTEEEIIYLWRSIKGRGLSEDQAWQAIVAGITLDMAFSKPRMVRQTEH